MLIAIIPVSLIVFALYLFYKKFIYKTEAQVIQEELDNLNEACPKWYMVRYGEDESRWCKVYVVFRWNERLIASSNALQIWFFICWLIIKDKKTKKKEEDIILEKLIHSNHREITQDLMNHIEAYNSFAKYLRLNHKDHDKYDKKIYEYYDALWDQNKITSRRLWMFSEITEQQIQEGK